jgi:hypothetical protein
MKRTGALVATAALLLSACAGGSGSKSEDPKAALISAMESTGESEGLTFDLSIQSDPESLDQLAKADGGGSGMAEEDAEKLLDSSITVSTRGQGETGSSEIVVNVAGEDDFEMKTIDKVLYLRADVEGLVETFGGDPNQIAAGVEQAEAQGLTFVRPAVEGEWISIEGLEETAQQMTGQTPPSLPDQQQFIDDLTASFKENATVTSEGQEDVGEHLVVSVPLRATYESFVESFSELSQQIPVGQLPPASEVPDEDVVMDVWVDDERVTQLLFDVIQFVELTDDVEDAPEDAEFAFLAEIDEFDDEIEVPEGAVAVDPQQIFGLFGAAFMGGVGAPGAGAGAAPGGDIGANFNCDDLAGAPPEVLSQFAEECPELQP